MKPTIVPISIESLTKKQLPVSLRSNICPSCGLSKRQRQTFCPAEYRSLPAAVQTSLYRPFFGARAMDGYAPAVIESLRLLGRSAAHIPVYPSAQGGAPE